MTRRLLAVVLLVALSIPALAFVASAGQGAVTRPSATGASAVGSGSSERLLDCLHRPVLAPASFVISCADANSELLGLHWTSWGDGAATAVGTYAYNTCAPTCVAGHFVRQPALVELSGALSTNLGLVYTTLRWQYELGGKQHNATFSLLPTPERLVGCLGRSSITPSSFVIACADANARLAAMHWTSWALGAATANAAYVYNTCTPTCVAGHFVTTPATVELSGARFSADGLAYTTLSWQYRSGGVTRQQTFALSS